MARRSPTITLDLQTFSGHRRRFKCPKRGCLRGKKTIIFAAQRSSQRFQYNLLKFMGLPINTYSQKQTVFSVKYITQSMLIWIYPCGRCLVQFNAAPPFHGTAKGGVNWQPNVCLMKPDSSTNQKEKKRKSLTAAGSAAPLGRGLTGPP